MRSRLSFLIFSQRLFFLFLLLTQSIFGTDTGSKLRLLLRDIIKSSQPQTKEQQRSLFEEALSAHPFLITEWLKGKSSKAILTEAQLPFDIKLLSALDSY
jgi:hypothetical protein